MKALHNSTLSKLESWVACVDYVTALTSCGVTLTKGKMWRHQHESASAGAPPGPSERTNTRVQRYTALPASEDFLLGNHRDSPSSARLRIGKFDSHAWIHQTRCIWLSNHLYNALAQSFTRWSSSLNITHRMARVTVYSYMLLNFVSYFYCIFNSRIETHLRNRERRFTFLILY